MADSKMMKDVKLDKCQVCKYIKLNDKCINKRCPMFGLNSKMQGNIVRVGLAATSGKGFDPIRIGVNSRQGIRESDMRKAARNYWRQTNNVDAGKS